MRNKILTVAAGYTAANRLMVNQVYADNNITNVPSKANNQGVFNHIKESLRSKKDLANKMDLDLFYNKNEINLSPDEIIRVTNTVNKSQFYYDHKVDDGQTKHMFHRATKHYHYEKRFKQGEYDNAVAAAINNAKSELVQKALDFLQQSIVTDMNQNNGKLLIELLVQKQQGLLSQNEVLLVDKITTFKDKNLLKAYLTYESDAYNKLGQYNEALKSLDKALDVDPNYEVAKVKKVEVRTAQINKEHGIQEQKEDGIKHHSKVFKRVDKIVGHLKVEEKLSPSERADKALKEFISILIDTESDDKIDQTVGNIIDTLRDYPQKANKDSFTLVAEKLHGSKSSKVIIGATKIIMAMVGSNHQLVTVAWDLLKPLLDTKDIDVKVNTIKSVGELAYKIDPKFKAKSYEVLKPFMHDNPSSKVRTAAIETCKDISEIPDKGEWDPYIKGGLIAIGGAIFGGTTTVTIGNIFAAGKADNNRICTIQMLDNIKYDNPLLNNMKLFNYVSGILGADKVLSLGFNLDNSLIEESVITEDYDLVLAGLISLSE